MSNGSKSIPTLPALRSLGNSLLYMRGTTMQDIYINEIGDVCLQCGAQTLCFMTPAGGSPAEWFFGDLPIINPWLGSGASVAWNTGQDATQASPDGLNGNYIRGLLGKKGRTFPGEVTSVSRCIFPISSNYYSHQFIAPDFILSHEAREDILLLDGNGRTSWETLYSHGYTNSQWFTDTAGIIFDSRREAPASIIAVGNEKDAGKLRRYPPGYFRGHLDISMTNASPDAFCGLMFEKQIWDGCTQDEYYNASGYSLLVNKQGLIELRKNNTEVLWSTQTNIFYTPTLYVDRVYGNLKILSAGGEELALITTPVIGDSVAIIGSCQNGTIPVTRRTFYDKSVFCEQGWHASGPNIVTCDTHITSLAGQKFYMMNTPALFLCKETFPLNERVILLNGQPFQPPTGDTALFRMGDIISAGKQGVMVHAKRNRTDQENPGCHFLLQKQSFNDECVMMINPLPEEANTTPVKSQTIRSVVDFWVTGLAG